MQAVVEAEPKVATTAPTSTTAGAMATPTPQTIPAAIATIKKIATSTTHRAPIARAVAKPILTNTLPTSMNRGQGKLAKVAVIHTIVICVVHQ